MIDLEPIFKNKVIDKEKSISFGFSIEGNSYRKSFSIMKDKFTLLVIIGNDNKVSFKVFETKSNEEYLPIHLPNATGTYIGLINDEVEKILKDISDYCFDVAIFKEEQTKRVIEYIISKFKVEPEFLWDKFPLNAVFRNTINKKWFAIIMTVDKSKLGIEGDGNIEIINLKDNKDIIQIRLLDSRFYKAYHMNKKSWYTICLNESICDDELFKLIDDSFHIVEDKK